MTILHKIKFLIAKIKGDVAKSKNLETWQEEIIAKKREIKTDLDNLNLKQFIKEKKKRLENLIEIEEDPVQKEIIDSEYRQLEEIEKTWPKTKI